MKFAADCADVATPAIANTCDLTFQQQSIPFGTKTITSFKSYFTAYSELAGFSLKLSDQSEADFGITTQKGSFNWLNINSGVNGMYFILSDNKIKGLGLRVAEPDCTAVAACDLTIEEL
jgi:hypothetical protein